MENTNALQHHGILGQKWGRRRFQNTNGTLTAEGKARYKQYKQDRKEIKTLTRHVSADARNLKSRSKAQDADSDYYDSAHAALKKVNGKIYAPWNQRQKREDVQAATDRVTAAGRKWERSRAELDRAERIYDSDVKELRSKVDKMVKNYGNESVKELKFKDKAISEAWTKKLLKTGVTVADIPIIGTKYTANYVSKRDYADRDAGIAERAKRDY